MSSYDLIKDLEKKLALYRITHNSRVATPNPIHERIAHYIHLATIYPRPLNRQNVTALLQGRSSWPSMDGAEICIAYPVNVTELEQARVIGFPNDDLIVQPRVPTSPEMPIKLRQQLDAHNILYELRYLNTEWESPHLRLDHQTIAPVDRPFLQQSLEPRREAYSIRLNREDVAGVGTFLWKLLTESEMNPDIAFAAYSAKMRLAAGHAYIFNIDFDQIIEPNQYLEAAYNFLSKDSYLFEDWNQCAADIAINHSRTESITKTHQPMQIIIRPGEQDKVTQVAGQYCKELDITQLQGIISHLSSHPPSTLLEGAAWWEKTSNYRYAGRETLSEYLIHLIIRHEHNVYDLRSSFRITQKLVKLSKDSPKLINALFSETTHPPYICFLLSNIDTNHIGLIKIYENLEQAQRPISEKISYEKMWQNIVWTQALEIFTTSFEDQLTSVDAPNALEHLCEMLLWFATHELNYKSRSKPIDDSRLPSLKNAIRSINYRTESGSVRNLIMDHINIIPLLINQHLQKNPDRQFPLGEWLLCFWCFEWLISLHRDSEAHASCRLLVKSYILKLRKRLKGMANAVDDPLAFDELDWYKIYAFITPALRKRWINCLDNHPSPIKEDDINESRAIVFAARMHFRLLLNLFTHSQVDEERRELAKKITGIVEQFGFGPGRFTGIFDYLHDNSDYSPIRLWPALCSAANDFTLVEFSALVATLRRQKAPLRAVFVLFERTSPFKHKELTLELITELDIDASSPDFTPEAFDIILKAANNGQMRIAKRYLKDVKEHAHKTFKNKISEISSKIDLKEIFDKKYLTPEEKIEEIRHYEIKSDDRQVLNEVENFRRYLLASQVVNIDHARALVMFSDSLDKDPTLQNATGLIRAVLSGPSPTDLPAPLESYLKRWIEIYESTFESDAKAYLSDGELFYILQLCLKTSHLDDFNRFWSIATNQQRISYDFAELRAEHLLNTAGRAKAIKYIEELRTIHQTLPHETAEELSSIEQSLRASGVISHISSQASDTPEITSMLIRYREAWLNIKDLDAYDQSQIFMSPSNKIDHYLIELVEHVGLELLSRAGNLQRKKLKAASSSTIQLDEEDMINDWFVSLVRQRMNFVSWTMLDQSRIGRSGSEAGVGESDGWVKDGRGNHIFLFEAFRLGNNMDTVTINKHLHKISNYNTMGISPIFIVVYMACNDFEKLCTAYKEHVEQLDYQGFDAGVGRKLSLRKIKKPNSATTYLEETRQINGNKINIYHHLLHFKPPK